MLSTKKAIIKKERNKERKHALDQESNQEKILTSGLLDRLTYCPVVENQGEAREGGTGASLQNKQNNMSNPPGIGDGGTPCIINQVGFEYWLYNFHFL